MLEFDQNNEGFLQDKDSTHGTFINNTRITSNQKVSLKSGDSIQFGKDLAIFRFINFVKPVTSYRVTGDNKN